MAVKRMAAPSGFEKRADSKDEAGSRLQSQGKSMSLLHNCLVERIRFMEKIACHIDMNLHHYRGANKIDRCSFGTKWR